MKRFLRMLLIVSALFSALISYGADSEKSSWIMKFDDICSNPEFIFETGDGGLVLIGEHYANKYLDWCAVKIDHEGGLVWKYFYGGSDDDYLNDAHVTADGGFILAGQIPSPKRDRFEGWIVKLDGAGQKSWEKTHGGDNSVRTQKISPRKDGRCFAAETLYPEPKNRLDSMVSLLDDKGEQVWQTAFESKEITNLELTVDGGVIAAGWDHNDRTYWAYKLDDKGNILWRKSLWPTSPRVEKKYLYLKETLDQGVLISADIAISSEDRNSSLGMIKLSRGGQDLWQKTYDLTSGRVLYTRDGHCLVAGIKTNILKILELDENGDQVRETSSIGACGTIDRIDFQTLDGGCLLTGKLTYLNIGVIDLVTQVLEIPSEMADSEFYGFRPDKNAWIVKLDQQDQLTWERLYAKAEVGTIMQTQDGGYATILREAWNIPGTYLAKLTAQGECKGQGCLMVLSNPYDQAVRTLSCGR